jgi:hypothetical protein
MSSILFVVCTTEITCMWCDKFDSSHNTLSITDLTEPVRSQSLDWVSGQPTQTSKVLGDALGIKQNATSDCLVSFLWWY